MEKTQIFLKKHSSTILTVVGATGVIGTAILSAKATPKALELKKEAELQKGEKLTYLETIKAGWKPYIPAALVGFSTIICIFSANYLNAKNQASLMSAYALLDSSLKEYRNKVDEVYGEGADANIKREVVKSKYDETMEIEEGKSLFFDYQSSQTFVSTMEEVVSATNAFLESFHNKGYACLNEYYDYLGLEYTDYGFQLGWFDIENNDPYNCSELDFTYEQVIMENNKSCWIITAKIPPTSDYII